MLLVITLPGKRKQLITTMHYTPLKSMFLFILTGFGTCPALHFHIYPCIIIMCK